MHISVYNDIFKPVQIQRLAEFALALDPVRARRRNKTFAISSPLKALDRKITQTLAESNALAHNRLSSVSLAIVQSNDSPKIRSTPSRCKDCAFVWFDLNRDWNPNWAGEIFFYDARKNSALCVSSKSGRLVVTRGKTRYRIGTPRTTCVFPRMALELAYPCLKHRVLVSRGSKKR